MCDFPVDGVKPDLTFYYDVNKRITTTTTEDENVEEFIAQVFLFSDKELKNNIGKFIFNNVYAKLINLDTHNAAFYFDNIGGIICYTVTLPSSNPGTIDPNSSEIYSITGGSGDYLNAKGFVYIITDDTPIRKVYVYFTKCVK